MTVSLLVLLVLLRNLNLKECKLQQYTCWHSNIKWCDISQLPSVLIDWVWRSAAPVKTPSFQIYLYGTNSQLKLTSGHFKEMVPIKLIHLYHLCWVHIMSIHNELLCKETNRSYWIFSFIRFPVLCMHEMMVKRKKPPADRCPSASTG